MKVFKIICLVAAGTPLQAQDPLTFSYSGTLAGGWLDMQSITPSGDGYAYDDPVLRLEARFSADYAVSDTFSLGAIGRLYARKGAEEDFEGISLSPFASPGTFDDQGLDLAAYVSAGPVTLSYGDIESAFSFATLPVESGNSPIAVGNPVLLNIGGGLGSDGTPRSDTTPGAPEYLESRVTRADVALGGFVISASSAKSDRGEARSAGLRWSQEFGDVTVTAGLGYENGPRFDYRSAGLVLQYRDFKVTANAIRQFGTFDYNILYRGYSASYDFGRLDVGLAIADQEQTYTLGPTSVFLGKAKAAWVGWEITDASRLDFEFGISDYRSGSDVKTASLAYSYRF